MRLKRALLDFTVLLPTIMMVLAVIFGFYVGFQSLSDALKELIRESAKNAFIVSPYYNPKLKACGCQVSVIRQT